MILAGRFQDQVGPRRAVTICGLFTGTTLIHLLFRHPPPVGLTLLFGLLFGCAGGVRLCFSYSGGR